MILLVWVLFAGAQTVVSQQPSWINRLPRVSKYKMYYYRVTCGEARTYEEAYEKAFATAVHESKSKQSGVSVEINPQISDINNSNNASAEPTYVRILMNKVCEYVEPCVTSMNIRLYVLWQVAKYSNVDPGFDEFHRCQ
ncbi:MAG: hypothetical protein IKY87_03025 [Paludibacteraceae bacterium]|nr:hypothetical protein [Paludibacteraceae bacterium]